MRPRVISFVLALAFACASPAFAEDAELARQRVDSARELYASGDWETAREAYEEAYDEAPEESILKAEAALEWGSLLWEQGRYKVAETRVKDALKRAKKLELEQAIGRLMLTLGHIEASTGKLSDAEATLKICARLADQQKDVNFGALCRINLRFVKQLRGKSPGSEQQYRKDLDLLKKSGDDLLVGTALAKIAELYAKTGQFDIATKYLNDAQSHFDKAKSVPAKARNRLRRAQLYQDQERWDDAARELDGLVLLFKNMRSRPSLATAYVLEGRQADARGKKAEAGKMYKAALSTSKSLGSPQLAGNAHLAVCEFHARHNEKGEAKKACREAEKIFKNMGVPDLAARAKITLARMAQENGDLRTAREAYLDVISVLEKRAISADDHRNVAIQKVNLCQVELKLKANGTLTRCRDTLKTLAKIKADDPAMKQMRAITHYAVGVTAYEANKAKEARENLTAAAKEFEALKDAVRGPEAYLRLGRLQLRTKDTKGAVKSLERGLEWVASADASLTEVKQIKVQTRIQLVQAKMDTESWADARDVAAKLVAEASTFNDAGSAAWGCSALARAELKLKNRDGAIAALEKGVKFAREAGDKELEANLRDNLKKFEK